MFQDPSIMNKLSLIWKTKDLRNKILIVLGLLLLTRVLAHIPISGVDITGLKNYLQQSQFFNLLDIFSGGGLTNFSIAMLGVGPLHYGHYYYAAVDHCCAFLGGTVQRRRGSRPRSA